MTTVAAPPDVTVRVADLRRGVVDATVVAKGKRHRVGHLPVSAGRDAGWFCDCTRGRGCRQIPRVADLYPDIDKPPPEETPVTTFTGPAPTIPRDRYGRPLIIPPGGGKPKPYTRATTLAGSIDDTYRLGLWQQRMVALGITIRPDLQVAVAAHRDDRDEMDKIVAQASEAAKASAAATTGTALHALCEQLDRGQELGFVPEVHRADLEAYRAATADHTAVHIEQMVVLDDLQVAGTPDRIVTLPDGRTVIADLKGLALTTQLPTPIGWTTMQEVAVGDQVLGSDGRPCTVMVKSSVKNIGTYVVTFDDGTKVVCDTEHIWWTRTDLETSPTPKPIQEVIDTFRRVATGQHQHRVPVAQPLRLPAADLPIDPYLLGCWLGDGHQRDGCITKQDDLFAILIVDGHKLGTRQTQPVGKEHIATRTVAGLNRALKDAGLRHNKHIPEAYLRGSHTQRLRLLQGLMDTDGTWNTARNRAVFTTTDKALALAVDELLSTLGQRPHLATVDAHGFGLDVVAYHVEFTPVVIEPFRLPRKAVKAVTTKSTTVARRRLIVSIEPGPDVATACIGVDSSDHTYLCGEHMIPTHNTGSIQWSIHKIAVQLALYANGEVYDLDGTRTPLGPVDRDVALVVHLPAGQGRCELVDVDIAAGWEAVRLAMQVRAWRQRKGLSRPHATGQVGDPLADKIAAAAGLDALTRLWTAHHGNGWTDHHTELAVQRRVQLTTV